MPAPKLKRSRSKLGRADLHARNFHDFPWKFYLKRLHLNENLEDSGGARWAAPDDLWRVVSEEKVWLKDGNYSEIEFFVRAPNRVLAKIEVINTYSEAKFFDGSPFSV